MIEHIWNYKRVHTIQAQTVSRLKILLLKSGGFRIDDIADKVGMNRWSIMLCINKDLEGGVDNALFDAPRRDRNAEITDDEKPGLSLLHARTLLTSGTLQKPEPEPCLQNISIRSQSLQDIQDYYQSKFRTILEEVDIKPNKIKYYCENRAPDFNQIFMHFYSLRQTKQ